MQVLITGMHRSGTSVIARLFSKCGCFIGRPEDLMPPKPDNPEGFWEHLDSYDINVGILDAAGVAWDTVTGGDLESLTHADRSRAGSRIHEFVSSMSSHDVWAVKDPRLALTFPLWRPLLSDPVVVWCVRHPIEIGVSLKGRNGFSVDLGIALWEAYTVEALKNIRRVPVVVASYSDLLRDPVSEVERLVESINTAGRERIRVPDSSTIETIVRPDLHRSVVTPEKEDQFLTEHRRRLLARSRSAEGWSDSVGDVALSELSKDEILDHRQMLKLEDQPVVVPEALVEEAFNRVDGRSAERSADLVRRLASIENGAVERLTAISNDVARMFIGSDGPRDLIAKLEDRVAQMADLSAGESTRLETRLGEISDSSERALAGVESRFNDLAASSNEALRGMEKRLVDVLNSSKKVHAALETRLAEISEQMRAETARLEALVEERDEAARIEQSRLSHELGDRNRELELVRAELERHQAVLADLRSSFGGRMLDRWWRLRSKK